MARHVIKYGIYAAAGIVCVHAMGCGGGSNCPSDCGISINCDMPASHWAQVLTDSLQPELAAESTVSWLYKSTDLQREYVRELVNDVVIIYGADTGMAQRYTRALDSVAEALPDTVFARVITTVATPRQLARKVRTDADSARLVKLIKEQYQNNPAALQEFGSALD